MAKQTYTVPLSAIIKETSLEVVYTPCPPEERMVSSADVNRPGLALSGYLDFFSGDSSQSAVSPSTRDVPLSAPVQKNNDTEHSRICGCFFA